ncbi:beta-N-acetylhexosaminidase [Sinorhizobium prairiense]|uniref:beta-N-acetylhexosaminidase n=1 Tax=unclassified Sinorhizobium TaxID=2613772 RepID=UPI0023D842FA|nr:MULTISPECIES: beta-N-acetylhexosaminidase [unclassified Sinorhizobium]WEJ11419.1 beta-N-acetylhexosaminidase [Sinorhizobium sp. M103]WEJ16863.1 beta-N-acetylhexosaminidase [Sinorhizobium sp. K101]WEJ38407.1 beta-N-acetylhexosaminidase [Sinorhizobium sp. C101]
MQYAFRMSESKAFISGCKGLSLTQEERDFFAGERPWGFILFGRNIGEEEQIRDLVASLRDSIGDPRAPVLIDQEGGRVQRIRPPLVQQYPNGAAIGEIYRRDRERGLRAAWVMGRLHAFDLMRFGITVDCLPVLDVPVPGSHDVIGNRAYGHDPATVTAIGRAMSEGLKAGGMLPVMKHMPGHGRTFVDSHHNLPVVSAGIDELKSSDFLPFAAMKDEAMAMSAHMVFTAIDPDNPATTSAKVVSEIIRGHIGFDGLLMSDDVSMNALAGDMTARAGGIIAAGLDLVLHCHGIMEEMKAVADVVPVLSGERLRRARAAEAAFREPDDAVEAALRAEFNAMFALA